VWHSLVSSLFKDNGAIYDTYALYSFSIFLLLINLVFMLILLKSYGAIYKLRQEEIKYLEELKIDYNFI
jgi:hypothetical protein